MSYVQDIKMTEDSYIYILIYVTNGLNCLFNINYVKRTPPNSCTCGIVFGILVQQAKILCCAWLCPFISEVFISLYIIPAWSDIVDHESVFQHV